MKTALVSVVMMFMFVLSCRNPGADEHGHDHGTDDIQPLAYTLYSEKTELFVEFEPLVVGEPASFAAHFTRLGESFLPLLKGSITLSLVVGERGIRTIADSASSPGIFRLALVPKYAGTGKLIIDIKTPEYSDQITIDNITIHSEATADKQDVLESGAAGDIVFLKEQAWKLDFANAPAVKTTFHEIIRTSGKLLSATGDELTVTANSSGIIKLNGLNTAVGTTVELNKPLFYVSGQNLAENNVDTRYNQLKTNLEKARKDYERAQELIKDQIITQAAYLNARNTFENAQLEFSALAKHYTSSGQSVKSPMNGFLKQMLIREGEYVSAGTPVAIVSRNKKLMLEAQVSQKYVEKLPTVSSAHFTPIGSDSVYDTELLNGKVVSYARSMTGSSAFLPLTFEIDNTAGLVPGAAVEVYLLSTPIPNAIVIPKSALIEEQGTYYVYVQTGGERFQKREVKPGASDGSNVHVLSGIEEGMRIVTKGAYSIKLSSASGKLPAHGHEH